MPLSDTLKGFNQWLEKDGSLVFGFKDVRILQDGDDLKGIGPGLFDLETGRLSPQEIKQLLGTLDPSLLGGGKVGQPIDFQANVTTKSIVLGTKQVTVPLGGSIQQAIDEVNDAGGGVVHIQSGTYLLNSILTVPSEITLRGSAASEVILDFQDIDDAYINIVGDTAEYTTGLINTSNNATTVTGIGTDWLGNVSTGEFIRINNILYEVSSVDSNTQITLTERYRGTTIVRGSYGIAAYRRNVVIENLRIRRGGSTIGLIGVVRFNFMKDSVIKNCIIDNSLSHGILGENGFNLTIENNEIVDNDDGAPMQFGNGIRYSFILNNECRNGFQAGIILDTSDCVHNVIIGNNCNKNQLSGLQIDGDNNIASNNHCSGNINSGIRINGNGNTVFGNICLDNDDEGIRVTSNGTRNIIQGNICSDSPNGHGIECDASNNIINGNICNDNAINGIQIDATHNIIKGNQCINNLTNGIITNSDNVIITENIATGNTSGQITDSSGGTNVDISHNIITT